MLTREKIMSMGQSELKIEIAERIFKARVIGQTKDPELKLLVGDFGERSTQPFKGSWTTAIWHNSEESAWEDCPDFSEDTTWAWKTLEKFPLAMIERVEIFVGNTTVNVTIYPDTNSERSVTASARTLAESACKAALLAISEVDHDKTT